MIKTKCFKNKLNYIENEFNYIHNNQIIASFENQKQLIAFDNIFNTVRKAYQISTRPVLRLQLLNLVFNDLNFVTLTKTIKIPIELLRLRLNYQLYLNCIVLKFDRFKIQPAMAAPLVEELLMRHDVNCLRICQFIYHYPSIDLEIVLQQFKQQSNVLLDIQKLTAAHLLGINQQHLYLIGRNPNKNHHTRLLWSEQWDF